MMLKTLQLRDRLPISTIIQVCPNKFRIIFTFYSNFDTLGSIAIVLFLFVNILIKI